jgi:uncharacterized protein
MSKFFKRVFLSGISLYQKTLSPDHSKLWKGNYPLGHCRYYPSCSEYAREALLKHGVLKGSTKALWRILRCHPWSKGGIDYP